MTSALPTLAPQDASLLEDLLRLNADVQALAAKVNRPLHQLLDWALSPAIAAYIAAFKHFEIYREQARQLDALTKLSANLKTLEDPVQVRLTAILRASRNLLYARTPRAPREFDEGNIAQQPAAGRSTTTPRQRHVPAPGPQSPLPKPELSPIPSAPPTALPLMGNVPALAPFPTQVALDLSPPIQPPRPRHERRNQTQSLSLAAGAPHSPAP